VVLETLNESILDRISQPVVVEKEVIKEVERTIEVNSLSDEDKALLDEAKKLKKETREATIKQIQANSKEWTLEELEALNDSVLKKIAGTKKEETLVDYSINGVGAIQANLGKVVGEKPLPPTGINFKNK